VRPAVPRRHCRPTDVEYRDEALRQTRRLEAAIAAEREKVQLLLDLQ